MKNILFCLMMLVLAPSPCLPAGIPHGEVMEALVLGVPADAAERAYLGLSRQTGTFTLSDVDAPIVIIEIFSMYCPHCQRHAPKANELYRIIEKDPAFRKRVKLIGVGVGNSAYEVKFFKKKYTIPFPLFDDAGSKVLGSLPGIRTPTFYAVMKTSQKKARTFFMEAGPHDDPQAFLMRVIDAASREKDGRNP